jgi:hypothetical protein
MGEFVHADIFFFITSIFVIVLAVGSAIAFAFVILILRDLRSIASLAKESGEKLAGDLDELRDAAKQEGLKVKSIFDFFLALLVRRQNMKRTKTNARDD